MRFLPLLFFVSILATGCKPDKNLRVTNFPKLVEKVNVMPAKNNLWVFVMAGQSNMAGRGFIEPQDTISDPRVMMLNKNNEWVLAKEPLHYYEPDLAGLDCGLSFAKTLVNNLPDTIYIGMVPCAVGGTSIEQWVDDSLFRGVRLKSNLVEKIRLAETHGIIKGILWHQGENNANRGGVSGYKSNIKLFLNEIRKMTENDSLPIIVGEIGHFLKEETFSGYQDTINLILKDLSNSDPNIGLVIADDLEHKGDFIHFNSASLRILGRRYAEAYLSIKKL